jgi:outer membrane protein OmpA-like peptidoglycan-associated protein
MKYSHAIAIVTLAALAACASEPERVPQLDAARSKVQALAGEQRVQEVAGRELAAADENLKRAEEALQKDEPQEKVAHLAYLAERNADIGQARIDEAEAKEKVAHAEAERNAVLLEARTQEVEMAKQKTAEAQQQTAAAEVAAAANAEDADAARRELEAMKAKETERGMVLTLSDVLFDTAAATLKPGATLAIDRLAQFLESNPDTRLIIEGHTDNRGSDAYNEDLSQRRARAVAAELTARGIDPARFQAIGRGEGFPVADNGTAEGRQQNRRVEIVFSDQSGNFMRTAGPPDQ